MPVRIYLSGSMVMEGEGTRVGPQDFPGHQGRLAFAYLVAERHAPVPRGALADAVWGSSLPTAWPAALSAIVSKVRGLLSRVGLDGAAALRHVGGCYELDLPRGAWVDHEAAMDGIHEAESALLAEDPARAYGPSAVAHHITRRPFLPGEESEWIERRRQKLETILVRALECRARVYLFTGEHPLAVEAARDAVELRPFRETAYQLLMRAHAAAGNTAEGLRVYERCRSLLSEELGVHPSPQTRAVHAEMLQAL